MTVCLMVLRLQTQIPFGNDNKGRKGSTPVAALLQQQEKGTPKGAFFRGATAATGCSNGGW
jgi:hypothetical protein